MGGDRLKARTRDVVWRLILAVAFVGVAVWPSAQSFQGTPHPPDREWRYYAGDNHATKYSPVDQINRSNVGQLRVAWRRPQIAPDFLAANPKLRLSSNYRSTPLMVGGLLYATNAVGLVEAFDPATGRTVWTQKATEEAAGNPGLGGALRGVAFWGAGADARLFSYYKTTLYALNPKTGEPIRTFGTGGGVDLAVNGRFLWNAAPVVVRDVVIVGSSMPDQDSATKKEGDVGEVRAFDVRTGRLRWRFRPIPTEDDPGAKTWEDLSVLRFIGAGNIWAPFSADDELGYVYLPTSGATNDMFGGHRPGANLYTSSIVCLDAMTGRRVWHFQTVHHDLFDYDNPASPILVDITVDGRRVKAVAQVTKQAFTYVLDRTTGQPVWPIKERPVPTSTVPGEKPSPTQPFPTKPPAFDRQGVTIDDLIDFTPELRAEAVEILKKYQYGPIFTPPSVVSQNPGGTKGTVQLPGSVGGANWTGAAFDPETGYFYVPSMTNPFVANLVPGDPKQTNLQYRASTRELLMGPRGLPLFKPPYGRITAFNLNRGEQVWMVPNGDGPRDHPAIAHLKLPPLGHASRGALLVTKTLLFAPDGDQVNVRIPQLGGGTKFRALDKATGATVWETEMGAGATGAPMTYVYNGKQYVVLAIGGREHPAELLAYSLH
ncbi:MAG: pyrroloquinoline quinone-dependent dehydrogenase [Acidimicrobiia bacterium]|nr:pyrroloquinoline quinone-dependent dehydrogenase [Acidimicrobiia bacterium]